MRRNHPPSTGGIALPSKHPSPRERGLASGGSASPKSNREPARLRRLGLGEKSIEKGKRAPSPVLEPPGERAPHPRRRTCRVNRRVPPAARPPPNKRSGRISARLYPE
ncbi:hypothetical protein K523DRAFT_148245 [Schizophyllum commune Tattone D]|nr:hypothetical protein K523DRAFT_148245 [Schizophyllum commune Tattone D]